MSKTALSLDVARALFDRHIAPATAPVAFTYDGRAYRGLSGLPVVEDTCVATPSGLRATLRVRLDETLLISLESAYNAEFGESEYTLWFENTGTEPSGVLSDVTALADDFDGASPVLRSCLGDHANHYAAYEQDLLKADKHFRSINGRATHIVFPYFDLCHGDGGTLVALGWAGTWETLFAAHGNTTTVRARTNLGFNSVLLPGEKVRTGLVVLLPYRGRSADDATNLWREWFMACNLPKADVAGTPLRPLSTACFAGDTGLPNSDGSISERHFTWRPTLEKLAAEDVIPDFRWFDAGWYCDPAGCTVESDWWGTIGTWEIDREKWPAATFRESNDACHALGMKVFVWFEPERVTHVEDLARNYGYKPEWAAGDGRVFTSNLGDPDCLAWTLRRITSFMEEHGVDMYREDNNSNPAYAWGVWDKADSDAHGGLPRRGISENKCIQGHYALWDGIIAYCAAHGKCTFVDSCASGGGRNDIESMRRGFPMLRSDHDRTTSSVRLSQTASFCKWIPFHGSSTKETTGQLDVATGAGSDVYVARASYLPVWNLSAAFTHNPALDYDLMRRNCSEWKSLRHLLTRDFYALTPWHHESDRFGWTAFAYDAPDLGESILLAFRMEECAEPDFTARLPFADPAFSYTVVNVDSGETQTLPGSVLRDTGIALQLETPRSSLLLRIRRTK